VRTRGLVLVKAHEIDRTSAARFQRYHLACSGRPDFSVVLVNLLQFDAPKFARAYVAATSWLS
jgi:hypothetical protein